VRESVLRFGWPNIAEAIIEEYFRVCGVARIAKG